MTKALLAVVLGQAVSLPLASGESFQIVLDPSLSNGTHQVVSEFIQEVTESLPPKMKEGIGHPVILRFSSFREQEGVTSILPPDCTFQGGETDLHQPKRQTLGRTHIRGRSEIPLIELNQFFLPVISGGKDQATLFPCGHKNAYRMAQATLIHELDHLYLDREKKLQERFDSLMGWSSNWLFVTDNKNQMTARSPDPYEWKSPSESHPVNMEYFLLDETFYCRRPAVARYLMEEFGFDPFPKRSCQVNTQIRTMDYSGASLSKPIELDPKRVYQLQYAFVEKGEDLTTRWGHAMLKFVVCAPDRAIPGPQCLNDTAYHVVIGFRANVDDLLTSPWKALTGQYPSKLFVFTLGSLRREYNYAELRNIRFYPYRVATDQEKEDAVYRFLELYWSYQGSYRFFSRNCATELLDFFKSISRAEKIQSLRAMSPSGLLEELKDVNLVSTGDDVETMISRREILERDLLQIQSAARAKSLHDISLQDLKSFLNDTAALARRSLYESLGEKDLSIAFYDLEDQIAQSKEAELRTEILRLLYQRANGEEVDLHGAKREEALNLLDQLNEIRTWIDRSAARVLPRYGIPLSNEVQEQDTTLQREIKAGQFKQTWVALLKLLEKEGGSLGAQFDELREVSANLKALWSELLSTRPSIPAQTWASETQKRP